MCSDGVAIKVSNLSKSYNIYGKPIDRLKQSIVPRVLNIFGQPPRKYYREFWALHDASFEIGKGETVGIIGKNGSGKSTLLQMICGILNPTYGTIETHGRIAALLELGSGFNPEFSGRENVYLNASVLGFSKKETDERFDDIAAFADIGDFLEQPIKTYSSGMVVRLAFAVNIMTNPEIMVVDEALAVGDMAFQAKCMTALKRIQENGATILFVSHDVGAVKSLCERGIYLEHGRIKSIGSASDVAELYTRDVRGEMNAQNQDFKMPALKGVKSTEIPILQTVEFKLSEEFEKRAALFRYGSGGARIENVELLDENDVPISWIKFDQKVKIRIYVSAQSEAVISVNYYVQDSKKNLILGAGLRLVRDSFINCYPDDQFVITYATRFPLQDGNYSVQVQVTKPVIIDQTAEFLDVVEDAIVFNVQRNPVGQVWTKVYLPNSVDIWKKQ